MKRYCKGIILDEKFIKACIYKCFARKWNRTDVIRYISKFSSKTETEIRNLTATRYVEGYGLINERVKLEEEIDKMAECLAKEIKERKVNFPRIKHREKYDTSSHKLRDIGIESVKQQIYDYVAVNALMELFKKHIGANQFACVPGRGQQYGKRKIERWIRKHTEKCRYVVKADIKKCYQSINTNVLKEWIKRRIKNDAVYYLLEKLIDSYETGLSIGSYLSTWLCNLYLSIAYRFIYQDLVKTRKKKTGEKIRKRLIYKACFYMDDIVLFGPRKADLIMAVKKLNKFLKEKLKLELKNCWRAFKLEGSFVDIMGYKIGIEKTTIRSKTFLKIRRSIVKAHRELREEGKIKLNTARRIISYYGKIKDTNSNNFRRKYKVELIIREAKRRISFESKIFNKAATC